ncbi:hypothetical protein TVAG_147050 [Trichomonas vaginalis G3]|uniref:Uncharacterized protein n=1 Tax=Trichomonas vaginalis (strain ATCC PRA-98 / G3) TaxID=412133 RepID=A2DL08_TRIV3|nr:glycoprotein 38 family [Trichomonas vaginalis G3]EAY18961.1 hypothetical protein TVAG_147050 [Trichomonas vaginalis G3]KAI5532027.1 glycoprotein 38 family [Trichomonas vaginalis G3]|eukprot:XP_001579947.1 hypothetical protein [Trichomonas vaginalis G3]
MFRQLLAGSLPTDMIVPNFTHVYPECDKKLEKTMNFTTLYTKELEAGEIICFYKTYAIAGNAAYTVNATYFNPENTSIYETKFAESPFLVSGPISPKVIPVSKVACKDSSKKCKIQFISITPSGHQKLEESDLYVDNIFDSYLSTKKKQSFSKSYSMEFHISSKNNKVKRVMNSSTFISTHIGSKSRTITVSPDSLYVFADGKKQEKNTGTGKALSFAPSQEFSLSLVNMSELQTKIQTDKKDGKINDSYKIDKKGSQTITVSISEPKSSSEDEEFFFDEDKEYYLKGDASLKSKKEVEEDTKENPPPGSSFPAWEIAVIVIVIILIIVIIIIIIFCCCCCCCSCCSCKKGSSNVGSAKDDEDSGSGVNV